MDVIAALHQQLNDSLQNLSQAQAHFSETERLVKAKENEFKISNRDIDQKTKAYEEVCERIITLRAKHNGLILEGKSLELELYLSDDRLNYIVKRTSVETRAYINDTNALMEKMKHLKQDILTDNNCYVEKSREISSEITEYKRRLETDSVDNYIIISNAISSELVQLEKQIAEEEADIAAIEAEKLMKLRLKATKDKENYIAPRQYASKDMPSRYFGQNYAKDDWRNSGTKTVYSSIAAPMAGVPTGVDDQRVVNHQKTRQQDNNNNPRVKSRHEPSFIYDVIDSIDE